MSLSAPSGHSLQTARALSAAAWEKILPGNPKRSKNISPGNKRYMRTLILGLALMVGAACSVRAESTPTVIRVIAEDAKFVGIGRIPIQTGFGERFA